ncbi:MAG: hypothetical protein ACYC7A_02330 [Thermoanaerobaculia bacterium]
MIVYRKSDALRIVHARAPQPPFWAATTIAPYSALREEPIAIDYLQATATSEARIEVSVCRDVASRLDPGSIREGPVLVDAAGAAEEVFRRGSEISRILAARGTRPTLLISSHGALPERGFGGTLIVATWPADESRLQRLFREAHDRDAEWGAIVPIVYPSTTRLETLAAIADAARHSNALFLAAMPVDLEPPAKRALVRTLPTGDGGEYDMLFHDDLETITVATERHVAALAHERGLLDHVAIVPAGRDNWCAAAMLARAGSRMLRMNRDVELGWEFLREAAIVAALEKPLAAVAEAASLSIIEPLTPPVIDALEEWLATGRSAYVDSIDDAWRLRRDYRSR